MRKRAGDMNFDSRRYSGMKFRRKRIGASVLAVILAGTIAAGSLTGRSVQVQASPEMMPGIETIVNETSAEKPFRILEIVDEKKEAEIGYYVSGQEPFLKLYEYQTKDESGQEITVRFSSIEEGLAMLPTEKLRREFVNNILLDDAGNETGSALRDVRELCWQEGSIGNETEDYPLSYRPYEEKYFLSEGESTGTGNSDWKQVTFRDGEIRTVPMTGHYAERPSGDGDYTKEKQTYYPIRHDVEEDQNREEKYRENIESFLYSEGDGASAPYYLEFEEIDNDAVNQDLADNNAQGILAQYDYTNGGYGLYENVYTELTEELGNSIRNGQFTFPGAAPEKGEGALVLAGTGNVTQEIKGAFSSGEEDMFADGAFGNGDAGDSSMGEFPSETVDPQDPSSEGGYSGEDVFGDGTAGSETIGYEESAEPGSFVEVFSDTEGDGNSDTGTVVSGEESLEESSALPPAVDVISQEAEPDNAGKATDPLVYVGQTIEMYPYYRYYEVGDLAYVQERAEQQSKDDAVALGNGETVTRKDGDITNENGQYLYWMADEKGHVIPASLSIIAARQYVPYQDIQMLPDLGYSYYYKVTSVYFCARKSSDAGTELKPEDYEYFGWYYASYPENQDVYIRTEEGRTSTHYISEAEYRYTPGIGGYDFIPGPLEEAGNQNFLVQVPGLYYRGGYTNHDWLKRYVFHLQPNTDGEFENFQIQVDTITRKEFAETYGVGTYASSDAGGGADASAGEILEIEPAEESLEAVMPDSAEEAVDSAEGAAESVSGGQEDGTADPAGDIPETEAVNELQEAAAGEFGDGTQETEGAEFGDNAQEAAEVEFYDSGEAAAGETFSSGAVFAAGENEEGLPSLEEYSLLYINSSLDEAQATNLALSDIPCIINQDKAGTEESGIGKAFSYLMKDAAEDTDQHYVSRNVYFFNAKSTQGDKETAWLVNLDFHKNFNPGAYEGAEGTPEALQGFEEILDYIDLENRYRELGVSNTDSSGEGDPDFSDSPESKVEPLGKEISQARAVEYILNYQYKRIIRKKETLNVLEIQPAKSSGQLTKEQVLKMLGYEDVVVPDVESVEVCSYENDANKPEHMFDGDKNTIWHTAWTNRDNDAGHSITITFREPVDLEGLIYYPRQGSEAGSTNGVFTSMKISLYNEKDKVILQDKEQSFSDIPVYNKDPRECRFDYIKGVKKIVISDIEGAGGYASCAELEFLTKVPNVEITTLTASEYVGHIEDINAKYDMIYIGDDNANRSDLINGSGNLLYSHIGGAKLATGERSRLLMGQLDIDYVPVENPKEETITVNGEQIKVTRTRQIRSTGEYNTGENGGNGVGSLRGSGNDITAQQCRELMDFVKSGYPVILGNSLLSNGKVNSTAVDTASYYWEFMNRAVGYENVASLSDITNGKKSLTFFGGLTKPEIDFTDGKKPPEPPRMGDIVDEESDLAYLTGEGLIYQFYVRNDSEAMPANTTYDCNLYLDLNFDGNLSEREEQSAYLEIRDENGNALAPVNGRYELRIGKQYTVERKIPENYYKLITWKLELVSNRNTSVRTSVVGYAKRKNNSGQKQVINVLHIMPDGGISAQLPGTWNLAENQAFQEKIQNIEDFEIKITPVTVSEYEADPSLLDGKQMLILGFDDVVQNISNDNGQVDRILKFIRSGRSAIFAHDTTSMINWDYRDTMDTTVDGVSLKDTWIWGRNRADWGLSLNKYFRGLAGLDRYGITDTTHTVGDGITISQLLKKGVNLTAGGKVDVGDQSVTADFSKLLNLEGDVAYVTGGNRTSSYLHTQGYTNPLVDNQNLGSNTTTSATKVNDGAITQYPYRIPETMPVAETHGQYYQLAMERDYDINSQKDGKNDIVVWYCLSGGIYDNSPNDVRNNYYFYSNGNVIYTGVGHSIVNGDIEMNLFINAIVAAANVTAVQPDVHFVKSLDPAAEEERFRYYMTDQADWVSGGNLLEDDMELYFNVKDYNMVSTSLSQEDLDKQDMTVQFFVEDENGDFSDLEGEILPTAKKLRDITASVGTLRQYGVDGEIETGADNRFHLNQNSAYGFRISNLEHYLYDNANKRYAASYPVYVRITSTVSLYGEQVTQTSWAKIDLKQRLLYELD